MRSVEWQRQKHHALRKANILCKEKAKRKDGRGKARVILSQVKAVLKDN